MILPESKVVYVLPPKCGTNTTFPILLEHFPDACRYDAGETIHTVRFSPELMDYTWVMNVRNPFTRAVSWWNYHNVKSGRLGHKNRLYALVEQLGSFDAAGRDHELCWGQLNFWWRATFNYYRALMPRIDHMVRIEHFCEDFNKLAFVRDRGVTVKDEHKGKGDYGEVKWWQHYTPHMVHFIEALCAGDFRLPLPYSTNLLDCLSGEERAACAAHLEED